MKTTFVKGIILTGAVIITASLVMCNRKPASSPEDAMVEEIAVTAEDIAIDEAVKIVSGGGPPMKGIATLLKYANAEEPSVKANLWLGRFGVKSGQLEKAKARFLKVIELEPQHLEATWDLAMLNMDMGNLEDAVEGFENCVSRDKEMFVGYFFMARCLENMDRPEEALEHYRTFLPLTPDTVVSKSVEEIIHRLEVGTNVVSDPKV